MWRHPRLEKRFFIVAWLLFRWPSVLSTQHLTHSLLKTFINAVSPFSLHHFRIYFAYGKVVVYLISFIYFWLTGRWTRGRLVKWADEDLSMSCRGRQRSLSECKYSCDNWWASFENLSGHIFNVCMRNFTVTERLLQTKNSRKYYSRSSLN